MIPFTIGDTIGGWHHLLVKHQKGCFKQAADHYASRLNSIASPFAISFDPERTCEVCGFSLVKLSLPSGWVIEICSATQAQRLMKSRRFADWAATLPASSRHGGDGGKDHTMESDSRLQHNSDEPILN